MHLDPIIVRTAPLRALSAALLLAALSACSSAASETPPPCGEVDQACCAGASPCGDGLGCSADVCLALPFADGKACAAPTECASAVCGGDGLCAAPTCSDGVHNGAEGDVDCGGGCDACAVGQGCKVDGDCARGTCYQAQCGFEPGGLLGPGGESNTVAWTQIASGSDGLWAPSDLAFNVDYPEQLWIVDRDHDALLVIKGAGGADAEKRLILDISQHFLEEVLAISFDGHGSFGTCGDSRNSYGDFRAPNDFMGPVQWPSDLGAYPKGKSAHEQHWDMLHSTPRCMGIVASGDDQFYCVNGQLGSVDWYDFHEPHVPGGDDHSDGEKRRYLDPSVKLGRVAGVPSNMVLDPSTGLIYIADSGNGRLVRFKPDGATKGAFVPSFPLDGKMNAMEGFEMTPIAAGEMTTPSGLTLHEGTLYVADYATGLFHAYTLEGAHLRALDSGLGAGRLGGLTVGPDDRLYFTDIGGKRVMRIDTTW